ncbi:hypothetical protein ACOJQI_06020 [Bacillus salacetis]|uniref:hypothetical protein n=1 Tax=Bacillus salacetis TaxID=2315464 RepID=UPI003B9EF0FE
MLARKGSYRANEKEESEGYWPVKGVTGPMRKWMPARKSDYRLFGQWTILILQQNI